MVMLDVDEAPRTPPPLRGVFATFTIGDRSPQQVEMSWGSDAIWTLRSGDARALDRSLTRAMLSELTISFTSNSEFLPSQNLTWDLSGFGESLDVVKNACS